MVSGKGITAKRKRGGTVTGGTIEVVYTSDDVYRYYTKMQKDQGSKILGVGWTAVAGGVVGGVVGGPVGVAAGGAIGWSIGGIFSKITGR